MAARADMLDGFHAILCGAGLMHTDGLEVDELALAEALVSSVISAEELPSRRCSKPKSTIGRAALRRR